MELKEEIVDYETFKNSIVIHSDYKSIFKDSESREWELVKVIVGHEFIGELTEVIKYEYRYRLYVSTLYEELGLDPSIAKDCGYWEKDLEGNDITYPCSISKDIAYPSPYSLDFEAK